MKKLLLTTAFGALSASQVFAQVDVYMTGSTAFRKQVYNACQKLYTNGAPANSYYDTGKVIGGDGTSSASNPVWTMKGTVGPALTALAGQTLIIHGDFTGSVQGMETVENKVKVAFLDGIGNVTTNTPTIAFSDVSSLSTPYGVVSPWAEEQVAVQPFVMVKSYANNTAMNSITNVTTDQVKALMGLGSIPLTGWSGKDADYNTSIYLLNRTQDSGTRRTLLACLNLGFNYSVDVNIYDVTNQSFYSPSGNTLGTLGGSPVAVVGGYAGYNNANLSWGGGYIGGGDISAALGTNQPNNLSLSYLSLADAQKIVAGSANYWSQVISLNGLWPTAAGAGIRGNIGTNDFTPICEGFYPYWAYEVVVYPKNDYGNGSSDQNITAALLGNKSTAGTFLGVLDKTSGSLVVGSLDNEIQASKTGSPGATAIRLSDMTSSRSAVGGTIAP